MTAMNEVTSSDSLQAEELTLEQQAGLLFHPMIVLGETVDIDARPPWGGLSPRELVRDHHIRFLCIGGSPAPEVIHDTTAALQEVAVEADGLPAVFSTDPRHSFSQNDAASHAARGLSQWPEPLGFGAMRDPEAVRQFADIVRSDYLAMGLRMALHPQVDLATEPRWARQAQSFGADHELTTELLVAYLHGLQGEALDGRGVAATTKHFPGGGPQLNGEDPHFPYGREQVYPAGRFEDHLAPFRAAIAAGTAAIMPYYGMPTGLRLAGREVEPVGFAFNRRIITELLREELGYSGVILSDFGLITDQTVFGKPFPARAWGVEHLSEDQRLERLVAAGIDQLGGEHDSSGLLRLVAEGRVSRERVEQSARRVLHLQERLGLHGGSSAQSEPGDYGTREQIQFGRRTQSRAMVVLANGEANGKPALPIPPGAAVYMPAAPADSDTPWQLVSDPVSASLAVVRVSSPYELRDQYFLERGMQQGSLDLPEADVARIRELAAELPVVIVVRLDRPAILTAVADSAVAIVAEFGASDEAVAAALSGAVPPIGVLPVELPRSMTAVEASHPDAASGTENPLFGVGHGIALSSDLNPGLH